jgi:hypothetical protein
MQWWESFWRNAASWEKKLGGDRSRRPIWIKNSLLIDHPEEYVALGLVHDDIHIGAACGNFRRIIKPSVGRHQAHAIGLQNPPQVSGHESESVWPVTLVM